MRTGFSLSWPISLPRIYWAGIALLVITALGLMIVAVQVRSPSMSPEDKAAWDAIYNPYFAHFHQQYQLDLNEHDAWMYADYYARYYAEYYTSDHYRNASRYALPGYSASALYYPASSPVADMTTDRTGVALIREFEGLRLTPYRDVGGLFTIGYGHLLRPGEYYREITVETAESLLWQDLMIAEAIVKRNVQVPLTQSQFSALVSLVFNIGETQFRNSTLLKMVNRNNPNRVYAEFLRWSHVKGDHIPGLYRRRVAERALYAS